MDMAKTIQVEIDRLAKVQDALMAEADGPVFNADTICKIAQTIGTLAALLR